MGVAEHALLRQEPTPAPPLTAVQYDVGAGQADVGVTEAQAEERQDC